MMASMTHVLHMLPASRAEPSVWEDGALAPDSLASEGFVHATADEATLLAVANAFYADAAEPFAALVIDTGLLGAEVRWEAAAPAPPPGVAPDTLFPHIYGPIPNTAVVGRRYLRPDPGGGFASVEARSGTAELLDLLPHPEGGWYRQTWRTGRTLSPRGYPGPRASATGIHFLLGPGEESRWHRVRSEEMWIFNRGGPLELRLGGSGEQPEAAEAVRLGTALEAGERAQYLVPGGTWQAAAPIGAGETLVTCVVSPGFDFADFEVEP